MAMMIARPDYDDDDGDDVSDVAHPQNIVNVDLHRRYADGNNVHCCQSYPL